MTYLVPANLRPDTLADFAAGLGLKPDEATDAQLTAAIARWSYRFDLETDDHFESQSLTLDLDGEGTSQLDLPNRCTAISTIKTRDNDGNLTTQPSTVWRLHSSLDSTGTVPLEDRERDWVEIIPYKYLTITGQVGYFGYNRSSWLSAVGAVWPPGPQTVQVIGTFGWAATPGDVKRAVVMLVYNDFKPVPDALRFTQNWTSGEATFSSATTQPFGIPFVDQTLRTYARTSNRFQIA